MPNMITKCPACGKNGILKKDTGVCVRCSRGASKPQVTVVPSTPRPSAPARSRTPATRGPTVVRGRLGR